MNKKGQTTALLIILVLGLLGIGGFAVYKYNVQGTAVPSGIAGGNGVGTTTGTSAGATCPDTLKTAYFQAVDNEAIPAVQKGGTGYIYDKDNVQLGTDTLSATTGTWSSGYNGCKKDAKYVLPTAMNINNGTSSAQTTFSVAFNNVQVPPLSVKELRPLAIRVKDMDTDAYLYLVQGSSASTNVTTYSNINDTYARSNQIVHTNKSVSTSGVLNLKIYGKASTARTYFGDPALKTYLCVDTGTASHWSAPTVSIGGGTPLADVKGTLGANNNGNDGRYSGVSASEYCYEIGAFTNAERTIDVSIPAVGGVDPDGADDIVMYFLPQGVFRSVKAETLNQPLVGVVTDASTQVLTAIPTRWTAKLTIPIE